MGLNNERIFFVGRHSRFWKLEGVAELGSVLNELEDAERAALAFGIYRTTVW